MSTICIKLSGIETSETAGNDVYASSFLAVFWFRVVRNRTQNQKITPQNQWEFCKFARRYATGRISNLNINKPTTARHPRTPRLVHQVILYSLPPRIAYSLQRPSSVQYDFFRFHLLY